MRRGRDWGNSRAGEWGLVMRKALIGIVCRKIEDMALIACLGVLLFSEIAHGERKMDTKYLYEKDDVASALSLNGQTFKLGGLFGGYSNILIFPVPQNNSVGTNYMGKGITIISFPKGKIDYDRYFRNVDDIEGSGKYMPPIASDMIGFAQVRVFYLFDFKKKIHREYHIVFPFSKYIESIAVADASQRYFIFEIESQKENPKEPSDVDRSLQLVDLSGNEPRMIKEIKEKPGTSFTSANNRVFLWEIGDNIMHVYNVDLQPDHHPLEKVVKQYKDNFDFVWISIHPNLPFAILHGGTKGSVYMCWNNGIKSVPHLLLGRAHHFIFSPDGKWVVYT
ncbi:MAG: hypothetical protein WCA04_15315, partial [Geobacteraceae bacterium]